MRKSCVIFLICFTSGLFAGNTDSLLKKILGHKLDSTFVFLLTELASDYDELGEYDKSISYCMTAIRIADSLNFPHGKQGALNALGNCYIDKGDVKKALESHLAALKIREAMGSKLGVAYSYLNLGNIHFRLGEDDKALRDYQRSLDLMYEMGDTLRVAICLTNMGSIYSNKGDIKKAQEHYLKGLAIRKRYGDVDGIAEIYSNLSVTFMDAHQYKQALEYAFETITLYGETGSKLGKAISYSNIGDIYEHMNDLSNAIKYQEMSLKLAAEMQSIFMLQTNYQLLALAYSKKNDFKKAVFYAELFSRTRDSLMSSENSKMISEMQTRFETGKKEKEIQLLQSDKNIRDLQLSKQEANIHRQRIIIYSIIVGLLIVLFLIIFIWRGYRQKKKIQMGLERKNIEISLQKNQIEEKSRLITDSIDYAKNIQTAILPPDNKVKSCFPDSFILFEPKDIVSGDFYFLKESSDTILLATIDCAGHGVPGAFMSIIANNMLENIVADKKAKNPSLILDELNGAVKEANKTSAIKYGMDISMMAFDKKKMELQFAGTNMPLVIVRNQELLKLVGSETASLKKGDMVYIFTDGLTQNGLDNFTDLLKSIANKNPEEQKQILKSKVGEQGDDVLVVGIKI